MGSRLWCRRRGLAVLSWALGLVFTLGGVRDAGAAAVRTVCVRGCDFTRIQDAVDAAGPGDTISVGNYFYRENVVVNTSRDLTIAGSSDTTLSGAGTGAALTLSAGPGVTIRIGIERLRIMNGAAWSGGGLRVVATGGGSIEATLANVLLYGNRATGIGGGICLSASGADSAVSLDVVNSTVGGNRAPRGGGVAINTAAGGIATLRGCNNVIFGNNATAGPNLWIGEATGGVARAYMAYSDIGAPVSASGGTWVPGRGIRSVDPVFRNPAGVNYLLHGDSPAIDRGVFSWQPPSGGLLTAPLFDLMGDARPQGTRPDQGVDEWLEPAATAVTLQSLIGHERIRANVPYNITWAAPVWAEKFRVFYSANRGASWRPVTDTFVLKRHVSWTPPVPVVAAKRWKVKVVGYTSSDQRVGEAVSTGTFTVTR